MRRLARSRVMKIVGIVLLAAAAYIVYLGGIKPRLPTRIVAAGEDPRILVQRNQTAGMDALFMGELEYDPDGRCLFLIGQDEDGRRRRITPVWSEGTKSIRENGKHGVAVPRFGKIFDGDRLAAGGGSGGPGLASASADFDLPDRCLMPTSWIFSGSFTEQIMVTGEDPRILVQWNQSRRGMDASITAELEYDPDGQCLLLIQQDGRPITPVWPERTESILENGKHGVDVPGYGKIFDGDSLTGSGGALEWREFYRYVAGLAIPDRCLTPDLWIFSREFREPNTDTGDAGRS